MVRLSYPIKMEIAGNTAMWTRPDTGDCPVSYPAPTYSATKAIFESVLWGPDVEIIPTKVELCAPIQYHSYCTNYGGPSPLSILFPYIASPTKKRFLSWNELKRKPQPMIWEKLNHVCQ